MILHKNLLCLQFLVVIFLISSTYFFLSPNSGWKRGQTWLCRRAGPSYLFPGKIDKNSFLNNLSKKDKILFPGKIDKNSFFENLSQKDKNHHFPLLFLNMIVLQASSPPGAWVEVGLIKFLCFFSLQQSVSGRGSRWIAYSWVLSMSMADVSFHWIIWWPALTSTFARFTGRDRKRLGGNTLPHNPHQVWLVTSVVI